ncbi:MAG: GNAT family N-acetyltransferase [Pseudomonadota bacterium]
MPCPTFRLASLPDAYAIALMSRELIEAGLSGWSWDPGRVARAIRARDTVVLVTPAQNPLVGFAIMNFGDTSAHLSLLAVKPSHQRCGIGGRMMNWLEESALVAGITTINLELRTNNSAARDFYRALGFMETACVPGYYQGVETALRMSRDIRRRTSDRIS